MATIENITNPVSFSTKKFSLPSPSPLTLSGIPSLCDTPSPSKKPSVHHVFPQLMRTLTPFSPSKTPSRPHPIQVGNGIAESASQFSTSPKAVSKLTRKSNKFKGPEILISEDILPEGKSFITVPPTKNNDSNKPSSPVVSPKGSIRGRNSPNFIKMESPKNKEVSSWFTRNANEFTTSPNGQLLRRLPIKDQWVKNLTAQRSAISPANINKLKTPTSINAAQKEKEKERRSVERNEIDEQNKFELFNTMMSPKSNLFSEERNRTGTVRFMKVRSGIMASWDSGNESRQSSLEKSLEDVGRSVFQTQNLPTRQKTKSQIQLVLKKREIGDTKSNFRLARKSMQKDNLSHITEYNWEDRHNSVMSKKHKNRRQIKLKPRAGMDDTKCFLSLTIRCNISPNSKATIMGKSFSRRDGMDVLKIESRRNAMETGETSSQEFSRLRSEG